MGIIRFIFTKCSICVLGLFSVAIISCDAPENTSLATINQENHSEISNYESNDTNFSIKTTNTQERTSPLASVSKNPKDLKKVDAGVRVIETDKNDTVKQGFSTDRTSQSSPVGNGQNEFSATAVPGQIVRSKGEIKKLPTLVPVLQPIATLTPSSYDRNAATRELNVTPQPTITPTPLVNMIAIHSPTQFPTAEPHDASTFSPTITPTLEPSVTPTLEPSVTPTLEPSVTPTPEPSVTPTPEPSVTPTPEPSVRLTLRQSSIVTPSVRIVHTPYPTSTVTPITTPTPIPTSTPVSIPTATPIKVNPNSDPRYGLVVHTNSINTDGVEFFLADMGVHWFYDAKEGLTNVPTGASKVLLQRLPINSPESWDMPIVSNLHSENEDNVIKYGYLSKSEIGNIANAHPGSVWYLYGELNRFSYISGEKYAHVFEYYTSTIKSFDSTAIIMGPSILNWSFTCLGCNGLYYCGPGFLTGYKCGKRWIENFVDEYLQEFSSPPDIDVWPIDVYPIDWINIPNSASHVDTSIAQISEFRAYLDTFRYNNVLVFLNDPIWVMELGLHVGYENYSYSTSGEVVPVGDFHWDKLGDYLNQILSWLTDNAVNKNVNKWFLYTTWVDVVNVGADGYMGITLYRQPTIGASKTCLGEIYKSWIDGSPRVNCTRSGAVIQD